MKSNSADTSAGNRSDDLIFRPSSDSSLGVELELQILDPGSGELASGAGRILKACSEDAIVGPTSELMQSMLEIKTGICPNVRAVRDQLFPVLKKVRNISRSLGYELGLGGTHPFHRSHTNVVFADERYQKIEERLVWLTSQRVVFGLHVHVGLTNGDEAIGVTNMLVQYLPHLLALSASSPFWQGVDTGLASTRAALYRLLPHAGIPRYFTKWKEFRTYCRVMIDCRAMESPKDIYWDIRPRPEFGTIEFRICDMPATLGVTMGLVALTRSLVISAQRLLAARPQLRRGDMRRRWIAVENKWLATRYGLDAMYIRTPGGKRRPLSRDVAELMNRLLPIARESGDDEFLNVFMPLEKFENGAVRQRRRYRETGNWRSLIEDMTKSLEQELDSVTMSSS